MAQSRRVIVSCMYECTVISIAFTSFGRIASRYAGPKIRYSVRAEIIHRRTQTTAPLTKRIIPLSHASANEGSALDIERRANCRASLLLETVSLSQVRCKKTGDEQREDGVVLNESAGSPLPAEQIHTGDKLLAMFAIPFAVVACLNT